MTDIPLAMAFVFHPDGTFEQMELEVFYGRRFFNDSSEPETGRALRIEDAEIIE